jgi:hypothetical protein
MVHQVNDVSRGDVISKRTRIVGNILASNLRSPVIPDLGERGAAKIITAGFSVCRSDKRHFKKLGLYLFAT